MAETDVTKAVERSLTVLGKKRGGRLAEKTLVQYGKAWTSAQDWCRSVGLSPITPWSSETLAQYAGVLLEDGYAVATIDTRLTGVKAEHRKRGWPVPDGVAAWYVLRGANTTAPDPVKVNTRRPRRADLANAARHLDATQPLQARDLCLVTLGWDLMCRPGQLRDLDVADVRQVVDEDGDSSLLVRLRGRRLPVAHLHDPVDVCPVEAFGAWLVHLRRQGVTSGPIFRGVDKGGNIAGTGGPYAGARTAMRLTEQGLGFVWSRLVAKGGWPPSTPKDMRQASSLEAAQAGVSLGWILDRAGWTPQGKVLARLYEAAAQAAALREREAVEGE
jgi:integrase